MSKIRRYFCQENMNPVRFFTLINNFLDDNFEFEIQLMDKYGKFGSNIDFSMRIAIYMLEA